MAVPGFKIDPIPADLSALNVPIFARISDYAGFWAIDPIAASNLWQMARSMDFAAHFAATAAKKQSDGEMLAAIEKTPAPNGKNIAIIRAQGLLMKQETSLGGTSTIRLRRELRQASADNDVAGILLAVDSPGGTVYGTDDLAAEIREAKKKKPMWCQIEDLGCSAAYWIASQCDRVTANSPTALIGSIGTIQVIQDMSQAAEKEGIKTLVFATGALKGLGTPGTRVTDEQITHVQGLVNSVQGSFDDAVKIGRGMSDDDLKKCRHGGAMTATEAKKLGLIDGIQPLSKTINEFAREIGKSSPGMRTADQGHKIGLQSIPMIRSGLPALGNGKN